MRLTAHFVCLVTGWLLMPSKAMAQARTDSTAACSYDTCALRQEGSNIIRGRAGERVGGFGIFGALRLESLVSTSDSARTNARIFDREYGQGNALMWTGVAIASIPLVVFSQRSSFSDQGSGRNAALIAAAASGLAVELWGTRKLERAHRALGRALWWHNRELSK
jgi:hypothetical protein